MVLPVFLILLIISLVPLAYMLGISLTNSTITKPFQGFVWFENYRKAFTDEVFGASLVNTLLFASVVTSVQTVLGFILAYVLHKEQSFSKPFRTIALLPLFTPPVAVAMIWRLILDPNSGMINYYMKTLGIFRDLVAFLGDPNLAMPSIMLADTWQWTPFCFLLCFAALQSLPHEPYEAAAVDGTTAVQVFWRLTLPMVAPNLIVIFLFRFLIALKVFDLVYILTFGGPGSATQVASFYVYRVGFKMFQTGYAASLSILMLLLISLLATLLTTGRNLIMKGQE